MRGLVSFCSAAALLSTSLVIAGCGSSSDMPAAPSQQLTSIVVGSSTPAPGSTLTPIGTPPGTFFNRGSGQFGVTVSVNVAQDLPFAQLAVFLLTNSNLDGYCGQNSPDWPTWRPLPKGQQITYTVTGFQVFSLPCEVTGIRAILNTREDTHLGGIPPANLIVADTTFAAVYHLRQQ